MVSFVFRDGDSLSELQSMSERRRGVTKRYQEDMKWQKDKDVLDRHRVHRELVGIHQGSIGS